MECMSLCTYEFVCVCVCVCVDQPLIKSLPPVSLSLPPLLSLLWFLLIGVCGGNYRERGSLGEEEEEVEEEEEEEVVVVGGRMGVGGDEEKVEEEQTAGL